MLCAAGKNDRSFGPAWLRDLRVLDGKQPAKPAALSRSRRGTISAVLCLISRTCGCLFTPAPQQVAGSVISQATGNEPQLRIRPSPGIR
jgi:hypothetical protein